MPLYMDAVRCNRKPPGACLRVQGCTLQLAMDVQSIRTFQATVLHKYEYTSINEANSTT